MKKNMNISDILKVIKSILISCKKVRKNTIKYFFIKYNFYFIMIFMILLSTIFSKGTFIKLSNLSNLLLQSSIVGILAMGQFLVILTGGIELSVGSILAACSMLGALFISQGYGIALSVLLSIALGFGLGFLNGIFISKGKIPPFIATLGMMGIARSLARQINYNCPIWAIPEEFLLFGKGYLGPIPIPLLIWLNIFFLIFLLVNRTHYGRYIYAVGTNENAARLSGVNVDKIKLLVYILAGMICGIGAIVSIGRVGYAFPDAGMSYNLDSITGVVIGGTSLSGGKGTATGVLVGVIIVGIISNFMNIIGINLFLQQILKGVILLTAVYINCIVSKKVN